MRRIFTNSVLATTAVALITLVGVVPALAGKTCACVSCTWAKGRAELLANSAEMAKESESYADLEAAYQLGQALQNNPPVCKPGCILAGLDAQHGPPYSGGGGKYPDVYEARSPWSIKYTCIKIPVKPVQGLGIPAGGLGIPGGDEQPEPRKKKKDSALKSILKHVDVHVDVDKGHDDRPDDRHDDRDH